MKNVTYWAFCGNEGTGKSVLSKAFAERIGATLTHEPNSDLPDLATLRKMALTKNPIMTNPAREMLLLANRSMHHAAIVDPLLREGKTVVSDRSFLSGMVYANIATYPPEKWSKLQHLVGIKYLPTAIVYCTSNKQKIGTNRTCGDGIAKGAEDIYDTASKEVLEKIDQSFEECINFIGKTDSPFRGIQVIRFFNDFSRTKAENLERLMAHLEITLKL